METALSGAGWETTGSQSVQARQLIDKNFHGLSSYGLMTVVYSPTQTINDPAFKSTIGKVESTPPYRQRRTQRRRPITRCLDFPRRAHRDRAGRRREELQRNGEGR